MHIWLINSLQEVKNVQWGMIVSPINGIGKTEEPGAKE